MIEAAPSANMLVVVKLSIKSCIIVVAATLFNCSVILSNCSVVTVVIACIKGIFASISVSIAEVNVSLKKNIDSLLLMIESPGILTEVSFAIVCTSVFAVSLNKYVDSLLTMTNFLGNSNSTEVASMVVISGDIEVILGLTVSLMKYVDSIDFMKDEDTDESLFKAAVESCRSFA